MVEFNYLTMKPSIFDFFHSHSKAMLFLVSGESVSIIYVIFMLYDWLLHENNVIHKTGSTLGEVSFR